MFKAIFSPGQDSAFTNLAMGLRLRSGCQFLNLRPISIRIGSEAMGHMLSLWFLQSSKIESCLPFFYRIGQNS